jgi:ABC-type phosphate transport system substrate-binding protein
MRVSLPLTAGRGHIRGTLAMLCAVAALAALAAAAPPSAHASFTIPACSGSAIQGEGSSLQKVAQQNFWITHVFYTSFGCESAGSTSPVTYNPDGSGCGIAAMGGGPGAEATCSDFKAGAAKPGERDAVTRFAGSDAPLNIAQKAAAEAATEGKPGLIHQIPVAAAAIAVVVHFPAGCKLKDPGTGTAASGAGTVNDDVSTGGVNDPAGVSTGDLATEETLRVHISAAEMETIWDGKVAQTWGNIVPEADFEGTLGEKSACAATPVIRIVRLDGSGTTYNFKAYLSLLPSAPAGLWTTAPVVGDNNTWPIEGANTVPNEVNGSGECVDVSHICTAKATGGGGVATAVEKTNGSIGYLDLATARQKGFDMVKKANDHLYWIPLQTIEPGKGNAVSERYVEPTEIATSHVNGASGPGAALGANCLNADYRGVPTEPAGDPTLGDWSNAIATGGKNGDTATYPICALTYDFAFDDDAPVYGNTQAEQEKARTVKDYLTAITSSFGQDNLETNDYGTLPLSVQTIAQKGVAAIDWNKAAGSGSGSKEEIKQPPPKEEEKVVGPPIVTPPSNAFSIAGAKIKGKAIVLSLVLPGAGRVQIKATGGGVTVSSVTANVSGGNGTVTLSISKAALKKLAKIKGHKFSVKITIAFTPTGGALASKTKTLTLTQTAITPKKKATKGKKKK